MGLYEFWLIAVVVVTVVGLAEEKRMRDVE